MGALWPLSTGVEHEALPTARMVYQTDRSAWVVRLGAPEPLSLNSRKRELFWWLM